RRHREVADRGPVVGGRPRPRVLAGGGERRIGVGPVPRPPASALAPRAALGLERPMRFDLDVAQHQLEWPELLSRTTYAEDAGFTAAWVFDHFKPLYGDASGPCFEAWTLLAALAASTERIRLGTMV